ncbi:hypothetical protein EXE10_18965 [Acinetobacter sp. WCHAc060033]|uniref:hypothetical protein n=1 Tax=Acinetobacter sp. WCHAc060033 TaxID=2518624 RepID=UPI0010234349|nr:hypothetical protein [Acinetobacter sp. WCHAc060033]RZG77620.1 hypothetical protein EXE10_18965 [Acinetobacter sp. WCHAc060033]
MDILNSAAALEAINNGFIVLCRKVGDDSEFLSLERFSADIFCKQDHEFQIQQKFMKIGSKIIETPESVASEELLKKGVIYFAPNLLNSDHPSEIPNTPKNEQVLRNLIHQKLLHYSVENAVLHCKALIEINGGSLDLCEPIVVKKRERKEKVSKAETVNTDKSDVLIGDVSSDHGETKTNEVVANDLFDHTDQVEDGVLKKTDSTPVKATKAEGPKVADSIDAKIEHTNQSDKCSQYISKINSANAELAKTLERIETEVSHDLNLPVLSKNNLISILQNNIQTVEYAEYETMLNFLLNQISTADTPKAINSLVKHTTKWTSEQRAPLLSAMHKRLAELNPIESSESTFMSRISKSKTVAELDNIYSEVKNLDPEVHERLANYMNQKRVDIDAQMLS